MPKAITLKETSTWTLTSLKWGSVHALLGGPSDVWARVVRAQVWTTMGRPPWWTWFTNLNVGLDLTPGLTYSQAAWVLTSERLKKGAQSIGASTLNP